MNAYLLKKPVVTEKTLALAQSENKYTFEVTATANKDQIKDAIESMYGVDVLAVNTTKKYRVMKSTGKKRLKVISAPVKKAIVELKKGQTIALFDFGGNEA